MQDSEPAERLRFRSPFDHLRTATLAVLGGTYPSSRGCGRILRNLLRRTAPQLPDEVADRFVRHSYKYWRNFLPSTISIDETATVICQEIARHCNSNKEIAL